MIVGQTIALSRTNNASLNDQDFQTAVQNVAMTDSPQNVQPTGGDGQGPSSIASTNVNDLGSGPIAIGSAGFTTEKDANGKTVITAVGFNYGGSIGYKEISFTRNGDVVTYQLPKGQVIGGNFITTQPVDATAIIKDGLKPKFLRHIQTNGSDMLFYMPTVISASNFDTNTGNGFQNFLNGTLNILGFDPNALLKNEHIFAQNLIISGARYYTTTAGTYILVPKGREGGEIFQRAGQFGYGESGTRELSRPNSNVLNPGVPVTEEFLKGYRANQDITNYVNGQLNVDVFMEVADGRPSSGGPTPRTQDVTFTRNGARYKVNSFRDGSPQQITNAEAARRGFLIPNGSALLSAKDTPTTLINKVRKEVPKLENPRLAVNAAGQFTGVEGEFRGTSYQIPLGNDKRLAIPDALLRENTADDGPPRVEEEPEITITLREREEEPEQPPTQPIERSTPPPVRGISNANSRVIDGLAQVGVFNVKTAVPVQIRPNVEGIRVTTKDGRTFTIGVNSDGTYNRNDAINNAGVRFVSPGNVGAGGDAGGADPNAPGGIVFAPLNNREVSYNLPDGTEIIYSPLKGDVSRKDGKPLTAEQITAVGPLPEFKDNNVVSLFLDWFDIRVGVNASANIPVLGQPVARGGVNVGLETWRTLRNEMPALKRAADRGDVAAIGKIFDTAIGRGLRTNEQAVDGSLMKGTTGFGSSQIFNMKSGTLAEYAVRAALTDPNAVDAQDSSPFKFTPDVNSLTFQTPSIDNLPLSDEPAPGKTIYVKGEIKLNVTEIEVGPDQKVLFDRTSPTAFRLNSDLQFDKSMTEYFLKLFGSGIEIRNERSSNVVIPKGTLLPKAFVDVINAKLAKANIEITVPLEGAKIRTTLNEARALVANGKLDSLVDGNGGSAVFIKSFNGSSRYSKTAGTSPDKDGVNIDFAFNPTEQVIRDVFVTITGGKFKLRERAVYGVNVVDYLSPPEFGLGSAKIRYKAAIAAQLPPWLLNIPKLDASLFIVRQQRNGVMDIEGYLKDGENSTREINIAFVDANGSQRTINAPWWVALLLTRDSIDPNTNIVKPIDPSRPDQIRPLTMPGGGTKALNDFLEQKLTTASQPEAGLIKAFLKEQTEKKSLNDNTPIGENTKSDILKLLFILSNPNQYDSNGKPIPPVPGKTSSVIPVPYPPVAGTLTDPSRIGTDGSLENAGGTATTQTQSSGVAGISTGDGPPAYTPANSPLTPDQLQRLLVEGQASFAALPASRQQELTAMVNDARNGLNGLPTTYYTTAPNGPSSVSQVLRPDGTTVTVLNTGGAQGLIVPRPTAAFTPESPTGIFQRVLAETGDPKKAFAAYTAAATAQRAPTTPVAQPVNPVSATPPTTTTAPASVIPPTLAKIVTDRLATELTGVEKSWLSVRLNEILKTNNGDVNAATAKVSNELSQRRLGEFITTTLAQLGPELSKFDPALGATLTQVGTGALFLKSLAELASGKPAGGLNALSAGLDFLASGIAGPEAAKLARGLGSIINLGKAIDGLSRPDGIAGNQGLAVGSAAVAVFATGIFGKDLGKIAGDILTVNKGVQSVLGLASNPAAVANIANFASFAVGFLVKNPEGQLAAAGLGALASVAALVNVVPGFGQIASAVIAVVGFIFGAFKLGANKTLTIAQNKDIDGNGISSDTVTFESKPNDWGYNVKNGTLTLPINAASYSLKAINMPQGGGRITTSSSNRGGQTTQVRWPDGRTQYLEKSSGRNGATVYREQTGRIGQGRIVPTYTNDLGEIFARPRDQTAAVITTTGYELVANVNFAPINDAASLSRGGTAVSRKISVEEGQALIAQLGGLTGWFSGRDPKSEIIRGLQGTQDVYYLQDAKSEGMSYYQDVDGDGVLDRITSYPNIKRQTENLDNTLRIQLLDRAGRIRVEYAVNQDGSMATPSSVAARYIPGGQMLTFGGQQMFGRINLEVQLDYIDKTDLTLSWDPTYGVRPAAANRAPNSLGYEARKAGVTLAGVPRAGVPLAGVTPAPVTIQAPAAQAPAVAAPVAPATIQPVPPGITVIGTSLTNGFLRTNQAIVSPSGRYMTVFQSDGNLVTYDMLGGMKATWSSGTAGKAAGGFVNMQVQGNLVVYDANSQAKWSSNSDGAGVNRSMTLLAQDDGNLVVYDTTIAIESALWSIGSGVIKRAAASVAMTATPTSQTYGVLNSNSENGASVAWPDGRLTNVRVYEDDNGEITLYAANDRSGRTRYAATRQPNGEITVDFQKAKSQNYLQAAE